MLKPLATPVFARLARLLGIPEIQHRLDCVDSDLRHLTESNRTDSRFGTLERHLERRIQQQLTDQVNQLQQQLADQAVEIQQQRTDLRRFVNEARQ